ncbi:acylphosphatase [Candidatus Micrarchaeota archaeon]|nr:acylphosphatase [Candidatus Micrarchaeota archaeon]
MNKAVHVIVSGSVQGVGYRYSVLRIAARFPVAGFVRNLSDGRVEIQAEGEENALKHLVDAIKIQDGYVHVQDASVTYSEPTGSFSSFEVRR